MSERIISVFGSNAPLAGSHDYAIARRMGGLLAKHRFGVATGGYWGTMAAVSQGASEAGGLVIGVGSSRIEQYRNISMNPWVQTVVHYDTLQERVTHLVVENDGMVVLPGGIGTLSELALSWSLIQVGELSPRPLVLVGEMWRETIQTFFRPQFVSPDHLSLLHFAASPEEATAFVAEHVGAAAKRP